MSQVQNEQTKLLANALNTAATSSFTVGVLAPIAAAGYISFSEEYAAKPRHLSCRLSGNNMAINVSAGIAARWSQAVIRTA